MRWLSVALSAAALLLGLPATARTAFAHGGQYRGPAGEVPPDSRQPEDPPPPDTGGGTPTPPDGGGGTPTPPDGGGGTPTPPDDGGGTGTPPDDGGGGVPPGPGPGGGTRTGGKLPTKSGPAFESWLFWWSYNKDGIINIKKAIRGAGNKSGSGITVLSDGGSGNETDSQDMTAKAVEAQVVPILRKYAEDSKVNTAVQAACVLSLAKIGRREMVPLMMQMAKNDGTEQYQKETEETAALSLGVLQERSPKVREFLGQLATNPAAKVRTRCFAAFSLGLLGDRDAAPGANAETLKVLKTMVVGNESSKDIACSALVSIGLLGDPAAIEDLKGWLKDEKAGANKLGDIPLSYAAAALGKIGQPGTAGPASNDVVELLADQIRKKNRMTRYSAIIALGQIGPQGDEKIQKECVKTLTQVIKSEGKQGVDTQAVNFALVSLGRIAGVAADASGKGGCPQGVRDAAYTQLMEAFNGKASLKNFAALGLGLLARDLPESVKQPIGEEILKTLIKTAGDVEQRGAMVITLGLLKDIRSAQNLQAILQDRGQDKGLRGAAAVALGLIGDPSALDAVHKALLEKDDKDLRKDTAIAAGLLRDPKAVSVLVETLKDPKASQFVVGAVANALGQIGDQKAVEPISQILSDPMNQYSDFTRSLAAVALGQIGDKTDIPVLARLSEDVNYRAYYDAIGEVLTIL